ncbi:MAG TPA: Rrf2 family transcriptional regulator [Dehalococcoidia bacterium]|nr:Rrf2 family transcriptional regulator [Dehalococcoidia bacterium]
MRISTKGDYGIRALVELVHHCHETRPTQSGEIAARQNIPESYLEQLLTTLRRAGFIRSIRGPQGGHVLIREPDDIRVSEVIEALEGPIMPIDCLGESSACTRAGGCAQRGMWEDVQQAVVGVLESVTIADLAARDRRVGETGGRYII